MAIYVVDASIVIKRFVQETYTTNAIALFNQLKVTDELITPEFCLIECVNVFWKLVVFHGMPQGQAETNISDLRRLPLKIESVRKFYTTALQIGVKYNLAVYDSVYIAMAKYLNYPLITADTKQEQAAKQEMVTLKPITDFVP